MAKKKRHIKKQEPTFNTEKEVVSNFNAGITPNNFWGQYGLVHPASGLGLSIRGDKPFGNNPTYGGSLSGEISKQIGPLNIGLQGDISKQAYIDNENRVIPIPMKLNPALNLKYGLNNGDVNLQLAPDNYTIGYSKTFGNGGFLNVPEQDLIKQYPHHYAMYQQQMAMGGEIPQYGFGEWLGKNAGVIGGVLGGAAGFFVAGPAGIAAGAKLGSMAGGAIQKKHEEKQAKKQQALLDAEAAKNNAQVPATTEEPIEEPKRLEAMDTMFALGGKLGMHSPMCNCMACGGKIKQYGDGGGGNGTVQAGIGTRGLSLDYRSPVNKSLDDYSTRYGLTIPLNSDQKFAALASGTYGAGSGFTGTGELSYTEGQGLRGRIDQGYNFQIGKDKLRAGKGKLNITPYAGVQPDLEGFRREMMEEPDVVNPANLDENGNPRGTWHGGLKIGGEFKPSKYPVYLFANGQAEISTKGPQTDITYKDGNTYIGDTHHGSLSDPNIKINGEAGVRYKIGEKNERGRIKKRFADGGEIEGNPKFEAEGGEVIQAAGMQVSGANNPNLKYYEDGSAMIQGNNHNGTSANPDSGVKMITSSATDGRIFSKRLKNPETKKPFAKEAEALLSKKDKYDRVIKQENAEPIARKTATLMSAKYQRELDALFQKQESLKQTDYMGQEKGQQIQGITPEMEQQMMMLQQAQRHQEGQEPMMHEQQEQQLSPEQYEQAEQEEQMMQQALGGFIADNNARVYTWKNGLKDYGNHMVQHADGGEVNTTNAGVTVIPIGINDMQARNRYQNYLLSLYSEQPTATTNETNNQDFVVGKKEDARTAPMKLNYKSPALKSVSVANGPTPFLSNQNLPLTGQVGGKAPSVAKPVVDMFPPGFLRRLANHRFADGGEIPQYFGAGEIIQGAGHLVGALSSLPTAIGDWKQSKKDPYKWNPVANAQAGNVSQNLGLMSDTAQNMDVQARKDFQTSRGIYDQMGPLNVSQQRADAKNVLGSQMSALRGGAGSRAEMLAGATAYGDQMNNQLGKVEAYKNQFDQEQQARRAAGYASLGAQDAQLQASKSQLFGNLGSMYQNIGQADREYNQYVNELNKGEIDLRAAQRRSALRGFGSGISDLGKTAVSIGQGLTV